MSAARGFGVGGGLEEELAGAVAARCDGLGYGSIWSSDSAGASGLRTLAALAAGSQRLELGIGTLELDRHRPAEIAAEIGALGLDPERLWLAFGPGLGKRSSAAMEAALVELRERLGGVRLVLAIAGGEAGQLCALAGRAWDGALVEWTTPAGAGHARRQVLAGADAAARPAPPVLGYVRAAVGADAETRLARDEGFFRELDDGYRRHFERLGAPPGSVGVQSEHEQEIGAALAPYEAPLDMLIVRALARTTLGAIGRLAAAAAPPDP